MRKQQFEMDAIPDQIKVMYSLFWVVHIFELQHSYDVQW